MSDRRKRANISDTPSSFGSPNPSERSQFSLPRLTYDLAREETLKSNATDPDPFHDPKKVEDFNFLPVGIANSRNKGTAHKHNASPNQLKIDTSYAQNKQDASSSNAPLSPSPLMLSQNWFSGKRLPSRMSPRSAEFDSTDIEMTNINIGGDNSDAGSHDIEHGLSFINSEHKGSQRRRSSLLHPGDENSNVFLRKGKIAALTVGNKFSDAFKVFSDVVNDNAEDQLDESSDDDDDDDDANAVDSDFTDAVYDSDIEIIVSDNDDQMANLSDDGYHSASRNTERRFSDSETSGYIYHDMDDSHSKLDNSSVARSYYTAGHPENMDRLGIDDQLSNNYSAFDAYANTESVIGENNDGSKQGVSELGSSSALDIPTSPRLSGILSRHSRGFTDPDNVSIHRRSRSISRTSGSPAKLAVPLPHVHGSNMPPLRSGEHSPALNYSSRGSSPGARGSPGKSSRRQQANDLDSVIDNTEYFNFEDRLFGKSFKLFSLQSKLRQKCYSLATHSLIARINAALILTSLVLISIQQWKIETGYVHNRKYQSYDWALFGIYIFFTVEMFIKAIAFGFIDDKEMCQRFEIESSSKHHVKKIKKSTYNLFHKLINSKIYLRKLKKKIELSEDYDYSQSYEDEKLKDTNNLQEPKNGPELEKIRYSQIPHSVTLNKPHVNRGILPTRAYLRIGWNRVDFVSVVSFWIGFFLSLKQTDIDHHVLIFRSLMCLKLYRLLNITDSTSLIVKSLRRTAIEARTAFLLLSSFWIFFAIIGVESFKTSLRRTCVWSNPNDPTDTYNNDFQFCGSYLSATGQRMPYVFADGSSSGVSKGFTCPVNSKCVLGDNPYGGTVSFDNILNSLEIVFVIISSNTFTDIMYYTMDSDSMPAVIFYIFSVFILSVWLISLIVAVVINAYKINMERLKKAKRADKSKRDFRKANSTVKFKSGFDLLSLKEEKYKVYLHLKDNDKYLRYFYQNQWIFVSLILANFITQTWRTSSTSHKTLKSLYKMEVIVSLILAGEIILRFYLFARVNWNAFFYSYRNIADLGLAIICSVILLPQIHQDGNSDVYWWLTGFQIARFYRVVMSVEILRDSWSSTLKGFKSILQLCIFFLTTLYITSLVMSRLFEGLVPMSEYENGNQLIMNTLPNCILSLYVISSTENWTQVLYITQQYAPNHFTLFCVAVYLISWFLLSNTILFNFLIAIITQNMDVPETGKIKEQIKQAYYRSEDKHTGFLDRFLRKSANLYDVAVSKRDAQNEIRKLVAYLRYDPKELLVNPDDTKKLKFKDRALNLIYRGAKKAPIFGRIIEIVSGSKVIYYTRKLLRRNRSPDIVGLHLEGGLLGSYDNADSSPSTALVPSTTSDDTSLDTSSGTSEDSLFIYRHDSDQEMNEKMKIDLQEKLDYIKNDISLYIFAVDHPFRKFCQKIVPVPTSTARVTGQQPNEVLKDIFAVFIFAMSIAVIIIACYATPIYRSNHIKVDNIWNWLSVVDFIFALIFTIEFLIKIVADGFAFTRHAYLKSFFNRIDFFVLISFWVSLSAELHKNLYLYTIFSAFRATRGLRLLTISKFSYETFNIALLSGVRKILAAALVALSLLVPFSLWGLNVLVGRLGSCTDGVSDVSNCVLEYNSTVFKWDVVSPNAYIEPLLEFNSFRKSILTLFEILSLEGWVDAVLNVMNSTGSGTPPSYFASVGRGIFIVLYNFIGIIFILNLFISIIINNYSIETGVAYLTKEQQGWYEVQKVLSQIRPSKRKNLSGISGFQKRCYNLVIKKNTFWTFILGLFLFIHIIGLLYEYYPETDTSNGVRYALFLTSTSGLLINVLLSIYALGTSMYFSNKWNIFRAVIVTGSFTLSVISYFVSRKTAFANINKLFLVSVLFLLIPFVDRLYQLLQFASASLWSLVSLLYTWLVLFIVYAICMTQIFGLTRLGSNTSGNLNCRTVTKSLILLFRSSFGEGWNYVMDDMMVVSPYCTTGGSLSSDCGNVAFAYILFISWNIISMYIFSNILISVVINSFSYVYHRDGPHTLLTRDEIRKFKLCWNKFDPMGTGFIHSDQLESLLRSLAGILSYNIYSVKYTIPSLTSEWITKKSRDPYDIEYDVDALNRIFANMDFKKANERRKRYNMMVEEARSGMTKDNRISFTKVILLVAYYSRFEESTCLTVEDFVRREILLRPIRLEKSYAYIHMLVVRWIFNTRKRLNRDPLTDSSDEEDFLSIREQISTHKGLNNPFSDENRY